MTLPPGRARLSINPAPTGFPALTMTMGIPDCGLVRRRAGGNGHCNDHVHLERHQLVREARQAIRYAPRVTRVHLDGLAVDVTQLTQTTQKRRPVLHIAGVLLLTDPEHSDQPHPILLRARRERKTGRTANKRDELAPSHVALLERQDYAMQLRT